MDKLPVNYTVCVDSSSNDVCSLGEQNDHRKQIIITITRLSLSYPAVKRLPNPVRRARGIVTLAIKIFLVYLESRKHFWWQQFWFCLYGWNYVQLLANLTKQTIP